MVKAYLTIYLSLILTTILSLCMIVIKGVQFSSAKLETAYIFDIAGESILAEYHKELFSQYNLLYIDSSYGTKNPSYLNTTSHLENFIKKNLEYKDITYIDFVYQDLLGINLKDIEISYVSMATDLEGKLFQKKAIEAIKDDFGIDYLENMSIWIENLIQEDIFSAEEFNYENYKMNFEYQDLVEIACQDLNIESPKIREEGKAVGLLNVLIEEDISYQIIDLEQYISSRKENNLYNQGNYREDIQLNLVDNILFLEYIIKYSGCYTKKKTGSLLKYQMEYILAGKNSDKDNLSNVIYKIMGIREIANIANIYSDQNRREGIKNVTTIVSTLALNPEIQPILENIIIVYLAYKDSIVDIKKLLKGEKVKLYEKGDIELSYIDYLRILLFLENKEEIRFRLMDIIEMDIRNTTGNTHFRIDGCIDNIGIRGVFITNSGANYEYKDIKKY